MFVTVFLSIIVTGNARDFINFVFIEPPAPVYTASMSLNVSFFLDQLSSMIDIYLIPWKLKLASHFPIVGGGDLAHNFQRPTIISFNFLFTNKYKYPVALYWYLSAWCPEPKIIRASFNRWVVLAVFYSFLALVTRSSHAMRWSWVNSWHVHPWSRLNWGTETSLWGVCGAAAQNLRETRCFWSGTKS